MSFITLEGNFTVRIVDPEGNCGRVRATASPQREVKIREWEMDKTMGLDDLLAAFLKFASDHHIERVTEERMVLGGYRGIYTALGFKEVDGKFFIDLPPKPYNAIA